MPRTASAPASRQHWAHRRSLHVERLEPRLLLAVASDDPYRGLLSHGPICNCPICTGNGLEAIAPQQAQVSNPTAALSLTGTSGGVPQLSSRPAAAATLYLDFDGNVESRWGDHTNVVTPAYDSDGNPAAFSAPELAAIREIWARVAEDYAPFNINVTTVAPPRIADRVAVRLAIGGNYSDWFGSSAGGVAYVGGFSNGASNVGFVFARALGNGNPRYTAEAASHEAGHLFSLSHQAVWSGGQLVTQYNAGTAQWAPIMGVGYYADRTTWASGPTSSSAANLQDDLSILAAASNGFGYVPDDYGNTTSVASPLPLVGTSVNLSGLIGRSGDRDVFKFTTAAGSLSFSLNVAPVGADLDSVLELVNAAGKTLVSANPANSLGASLATTVGAGTYYLVVRPSGGYGNLGRYTVHGSIPSGSVSLAQTPQPTPTQVGVSTGNTSPTDASTTTAVRIIDNGTAGFFTRGIWQTATGAGNAGDLSWAAPGKGEAVATWNFTGLAPGQYRVAASWPGSQLYASDAPYLISSGSQPLGIVRVNQQRAASTFADAGGQWQNLGTFTVQGNSLTVRLTSAASGRVIADGIRLERVYATSGGTATGREMVLANSDAALLQASAVQPSGRASELSIGDSIATRQSVGLALPGVAPSLRSPVGQSQRQTSTVDTSSSSTDDPIESAAADEFFADAALDSRLADAQSETLFAGFRILGTRGLTSAWR